MIGRRTTRWRNHRIGKLVKLFNMAAFEDTFSVWSETFSILINSSSITIFLVFFFFSFRFFSCQSFDFPVSISVSYWETISDETIDVNDVFLYFQTNWQARRILLQSVRHLILLSWEMWNMELKTLRVEFASQWKNWQVSVMNSLSSTGPSKNSMLIILKHNCLLPNQVRVTNRQHLWCSNA